MNSIIFIAPPAAGKGTQSELISDEYNLVHISTGDLLRNESLKNTELGNYIQKELKSGNLIDDDVVTNILVNRLKQTDCNNGYILDGYPRNINQAIILENLLKKINKPINYVFYLTIDKNLAMKRACGRLNCPKCGKIYNKFFSETKPINDNLCDFCNLQLIHRNDDNENLFNKRFDTYIEATQPLIDYYMNNNILYTIDSSVDKNFTYNQIKKILK